MARAKVILVDADVIAHFADCYQQRLLDGRAMRPIYYGCHQGE